MGDDHMCQIVAYGDECRTSDHAQRHDGAVVGTEYDPEDVRDHQTDESDGTAKGRHHRRQHDADTKQRDHGTERNAFVHNDKDVEVKITVTETDNNIIIRISDNGRGMSEEDISHIFERYYRGTGSGKTEGTGLGLAIAKEIVLLHGGKIDVKSETGKGTAFTISLRCQSI